MTADNYHGKECKIVLKDDGEGTTYLNNTTTAINAKGFDVTMTQTIDELFSQDSILRQDVVRTAVNCPVKVSWIKNDGVLLANIMGTQTADKDVDGNADVGRTRGSILDSPTMNLYNLWGYATSGSNTYMVKAVNIAFTSIPLMVAPEDGWVQVDLEGSAEQVYIEYAT